MIGSLELFLVGLAATFDLALLLILLDKVNHRQVPIWLKVLVGSATVYHISYFLRLVIQSSDSSIALIVDRILMVFLSAGLVLMPSALLHASLRLNHTGVDPRPPIDRRYLLVYLPIGILIWVAITCYTTQSRIYLEAVDSIKHYYLTWFTVVNLASAYFFNGFRKRLNSAYISHFFAQLNPLLLMVTIAVIVYGILPIAHPLEPFLRIAISLFPLFIASLFVWHTLQQGLLPLVLERTFLYGGIFLVLLLLHRIVVTPIELALRSQYEIDLVLIEAVVVTFAVLCIAPLRERFSEAIRFLLSRNAFRLRDSIRELSQELSTHIENDSAPLCQWFAREILVKLELQSVIIVIESVHQNHDQKELDVYLPRENAIQGDTKRTNEINWENLSEIKQSVMPLFDPRNLAKGVLKRGDRFNESNAEIFEKLATNLAFPIRYGSINGIVLLGNRHRCDQFAEEQIVSLRVVFDQFAAILQIKNQEQLRLNAERHSMQQEKLSTIGLIAGALAHELRNPLSSIRTIATLVSEELPENSRCHSDLQLIIHEVDRLHQTSHRLLDFARPCDDSKAMTEPDRVVTKLLHVMNYLAQHHHVELECDLGCESVFIPTSDTTVSEILINLIKNAIEAAATTVQSCGKVNIRSSVEKNHYTISISDNGTGIEESIQRNLFKPFVSGKEDGTGLGLYVVAERISSIDGTIECFTTKGSGTSFLVKLPTCKSIPQTSVLTLEHT